MQLNRTPGLPVTTQAATGDLAAGRYVTFTVVAVALFMNSVDQTIVATVLGALQNDFRSDVNWSSWTITIYALAQIVSMPLSGVLSEQVGRRRLLLGAVACFTAASVLCGLAPDIRTLVVLRFVQGLAGGAFMPSATGIVSDIFGRDRDRAIGFFSSVIPIGGVLGPLLGGLFVTSLSWRWIFWVNLPLGIAVLIGLLLFVPDSRPSQARRFDMWGVAFLVGGLLALMTAMSVLGSDGTSPWSTMFVAPLAAGLALAGLFLRHSAVHEHAFIPKQMLWGRGFGVINTLNFLFGFTVLGFGPLLPLYAVHRYGLDALAAGSVLTARGIGMITVAGLAVLAMRRTGQRLPMMVGFALAAVGLVLTALPSPWSAPQLWLCFAVATTGLGMGLVMPSSNNAGLQLAPERAATAAGLRGTCRQSGSITGIAVVTTLVARSSDPGVAQADAFVLLAAVLVLAIPFIRLVPEHRGDW